jgi:hypothetical protein
VGEGVRRCRCSCCIAAAGAVAAASATATPTPTIVCLSFSHPRSQPVLVHIHSNARHGCCCTCLPLGPHTALSVCAHPRLSTPASFVCAHRHPRLSVCPVSSTCAHTGHHAFTSALALVCMRLCLCLLICGPCSCWLALVSHAHSCLLVCICLPVVMCWAGLEALSQPSPALTRAPSGLRPGLRSQKPEPGAQAWASTHGGLAPLSSIGKV